MNLRSRKSRIVKILSGLTALMLVGLAYVALSGPSHPDPWRADIRFSQSLLGFGYATPREAAALVDGIQIYASKEKTRHRLSLTEVLTPIKADLIYETRGRVAIKTLLSAANQFDDQNLQGCVRPGTARTLYILAYDRVFLRIGYFQVEVCVTGTDATAAIYIPMPDPGGASIAYSRQFLAALDRLPGMTDAFGRP